MYAKEKGLQSLHNQQSCGSLEISCYTFFLILLQVSHMKFKHDTEMEINTMIKYLSSDNVFLV